MKQEHRDLFEALRRHYGSYSEAARQLGISPRTMRRIRATGRVRPQVARMARMLLGSEDDRGGETPAEAA